MKQTSLRFRLTVLSFASITLALIATTFVLNARFYQYFEERINLELAQHLEQLATNISLTESDEIEVAPLLDRRFNQPFSGLYWQVVVSDETTHLSRSLWGKAVTLPVGIQTGERFEIREISPSGSPVMVSGWSLSVGEGATEQQIILAVATDEAELLTAAQDFQTFLTKWLAIMMFGLIAAAWFQIGVGLAPLGLIKRQVEKIKNGTQSRLTGEYPSEVTPLVDEMNNLLQGHEDSLVIARAKAGDLAHGLKTPLTVMRALLSENKSDMVPENVSEIENQISAMHRFIERELAQVWYAKIGQKSLVSPNVSNMVASMKKLPRGAELDWVVDIPDNLEIPFDHHDLAELLGNILDNARKWATSQVVISGGNKTNLAGWIKVEDNGAGVSTDMLDKISRRGTRAANDESGSGLGLSISKDLMSSIQGDLEFSQSNLGGLSVQVTW